MAHKQFEIEVWGTILFIDVTSPTLNFKEIDSAIDKVKKFVYKVDNEFSTYKENSFVSRLLRGDIKIKDCPAEVIEVWNACAIASEFTDGAFNPWSVPGGFDPSGYVKGWAADKCADILVDA